MEIIRVSSKKSLGSLINLTKTGLKENDSAELQAIGGSIQTAIKVAEAMINLRYTTLQKFETSMLEEAGENGNIRRIAKVAIRLGKAASFDEAEAEFEKKRLQE